MRLGAALIVHDESRFLPGCLESLVGVVDEIVVVDTGSVDGTPDIARAFGATVLEVPWDHDFAAARNAGLDAVTADWVLYIDADERVRAVGDLRERMADPAHLALLVRFRPVEAHTRYWEHRLFRARPDLRFRGAIHETILPDIVAISGREGRVIAPSEVVIDHLGYEGDLRHKHERNRPLLERAVLDDPERSYLWHELGAVHRALGDDAAADAAWARGVEVTRLRVVDPIDALPWGDLVVHRLHRGVDCTDLVAEMAGRFGDGPLVRWVRVQQSLFARRWADAVVDLDELVAIDAESLVDPCLSFDRRIFGELAYAALGTCWFHLDDPARSAEWFRRAEVACAAAAPLVQGGTPAEPVASGADEYRVKRLLAESRAARLSRSPS